MTIWLIEVTVEALLKKSLGGHLGFLGGDTLKDKRPRANRMIPLVVTFHPALPNIRMFYMGFIQFCTLTGVVLNIEILDVEFLTSLI